MKSRRVTVKEISEEVIRRLVTMRQSGLSITAIQKTAEQEGLKTVKGDVLSYYKVKDVLYR